MLHLTVNGSLPRAADNFSRIHPKADNDSLCKIHFENFPLSERSHHVRPPNTISALSGDSLAAVQLR
jgi:hypothetical protein